jgi:hypothetical protein
VIAAENLDDWISVRGFPLWLKFVEDLSDYNRNTMWFKRVKPQEGFITSEMAQIAVSKPSLKMYDRFIVFG